MHDQLQIIKGQALVLTGPQGCGKTVTALRLARECGNFVQADILELRRAFGLGNLLAENPKTLILECEADRLSEQDREEILCKLKEILTNEAIEVDRKMKPTRSAPSPNVIICASGEWPNMRGDRRFRVVDLTKSATGSTLH